MTPAPNIKKAGNAPSGNKLMANFPGPDLPDQVQIKGTTDKQPLKGNSGNWISDKKYTSVAITLQLIKNGVVVEEYAYDANGNLALPDAAITNYAVATTNGIVTTSWDSTKENGISAYVIDRKLSADTSYTNGVQVTFPTGVGSSYALDDMPPSAGTFSYRLRTLFDNGTEKVLAESAVTLSAPPDAVIANFRIAALSGIASASWDSTKESSISAYVLDRKLSGDANYTNGVQVTFPTGAGSSYSLDDAPLAAGLPSGTYSYRLRVMFGDGSEKNLGEGSVTV